MSVGSDVVIVYGESRFCGRLGVLVEEVTKFDTPHWMVKVGGVDEPMLFGESVLMEI